MKVMKGTEKNPGCKLCKYCQAKDAALNNVMLCYANPTEQWDFYNGWVVYPNDCKTPEEGQGVDRHHRRIRKMKSCANCMHNDVCQYAHLDNACPAWFNAANVPCCANCDSMTQCHELSDILHMSKDDIKEAMSGACNEWQASRAKA
jgi:hypothetical protein